MAQVVAQARAFATDSSAARLDRLAASVRGFDGPPERERQKAIAVLVARAPHRWCPSQEIPRSRRPSGGLPSSPAVQEQSLAPPRLPPHLPPRDAAERRRSRYRRHRLQAKGLARWEIPLLNLPRRYEDRRTPRTVAEAPVGERSVIPGASSRRRIAPTARKAPAGSPGRDDAGAILVCIWFHYRPSFLQRFPLQRAGARLGRGAGGYRGGGKVMHHPDVEMLGRVGRARGARRRLLRPGGARLYGRRRGPAAHLPPHREARGRRVRPLRRRCVARLAPAPPPPPPAS